MKENYSNLRNLPVLSCELVTLYIVNDILLNGWYCMLCGQLFLFIASYRYILMPIFMYTVQFNSLAPWRFQFNFRKVIFKLNLVNGGWGISYEIALRWMPQDLTNDKSTLVQVMAWCRQAASHNLSQCWPRFMLPNGITRPQLVNSAQ